MCVCDLLSTRELVKQGVDRGGMERGYQLLNLWKQDADQAGNRLLELVAEFKAVLKSKQPKRLLDWMEDVLALNIIELNRFLAGLKNDIDAILKAVEHAFSNGLAEGTVNKIKVIKRVMYRRCGFELLRSKCQIGRAHV